MPTDDLVKTAKQATQSRDTCCEETLQNEMLVIVIELPVPYADAVSPAAALVCALAVIAVLSSLPVFGAVLLIYHCIGASPRGTLA